MDSFFHKRKLECGIFSLSCALVFHLQAGGSGLNTVVVVNQSSFELV